MGIKVNNFKRIFIFYCLSTIIHKRTCDQFAVLDKFQRLECQSVAMSIWDKNQPILSFMKKFQIIRNV